MNAIEAMTMPPTVGEMDIYECQSCGDLRLGQAEMDCCDESMTALDATAPVEPPELDYVMRDVFGVASTELDVCRCVMESKEATVQELTTQLDRDRSVITRHVNHLVELGVVEKESRTLPEGGRVNVYSPTSVEMVRRQFKLGLYTWLIDAADVVDELTQEKIEAMAKRQEEMETDDAERSAIDRLFDRFRSR